MIDGGKYREQKLTVHRHADGRLRVFGSVSIDNQVVGTKSEETQAGGIEQAARSVCANLGLDEFTLGSCLRAYTGK
jgi:hypothetical protein